MVGKGGTSVEKEKGETIKGIYLLDDRKVGNKKKSGHYFRGGAWEESGRRKKRGGWRRELEQEKVKKIFRKGRTHSNENRQYQNPPAKGLAAQQVLQCRQWEKQGKKSDGPPLTDDGEKTRGSIGLPKKSRQKNEGGREGGGDFLWGAPGVKRKRYYSSLGGRERREKRILPVKTGFLNA